MTCFLLEFRGWIHCNRTSYNAVLMQFGAPLFYMESRCPALSTIMVGIRL